jgi:glutathione reductase (NADPH)
MAHDFDLITLGAGSGGVAASRRAAAHGARVAIVEAGRVGGTCVLRGCVPKKLLMYAAQFGDAFADARGYGWAFGQDAPAFDMARWQAAKTAETDRLEGIYRQMLSTAKVTLIEGHARLAGAGRVVVRDAAGGERDVTAAHVLIATPASKAAPPATTCSTWPRCHPMPPSLAGAISRSSSPACWRGWA